MSLTFGSGPFGSRPAGRFNADLRVPEPLLYFERSPLRVRALLAGETVVDSHRTMLLHESGHLPVYWFPRDDVQADLLVPGERSERVAGQGELRFYHVAVGDRVARDAVREVAHPEDRATFLDAHVAVDWDAMDEWFAEDEQLFGHARDPYSRIDVLKTTRHVRVMLDGYVLADSRRSRMLVETALPPRFYLPPEDVRTELLLPSPHRTRCAYKGSAAYWHVRIGDRVEEDLVWSYPQPQHDAEAGARPPLLLQRARRPRVRRRDRRAPADAVVAAAGLTGRSAGASRAHGAAARSSIADDRERRAQAAIGVLRTLVQREQGLRVRGGDEVLRHHRSS